MQVSSAKKKSTTKTTPRLAAVPPATPPQRDEQAVRAASGLRHKLERAANTVWTAHLALAHIARGCTETEAVAAVLDPLASDMLAWGYEYDERLAKAAQNPEVQ